jgi:hypothetical protein
MIWILSPLLYSSFVKISEYIKIPFQKELRKLNNIALSIFSGGLCALSTLEIYNQTEDLTISSIVCKTYIETDTLYYIMYTFYLSKFWEWLDTYFIVHSNKKVTNLHYFHHMSTPSLAYVNTFYNGVTPSYIYACFLNTFVHTLMYWYYAFPDSKIRKYKKLITKIQIFQHIYMVFSTFYIIRNCYSEKIYLQLIMTLVCYGYYFTMFLKFYINTYFN